MHDTSRTLNSQIFNGQKMKIPTCTNIPPKMLSLSFEPAAHSFGKGIRILRSLVEPSDPVVVTLDISGYCRPGEVEPFQLTKRYIWSEIYHMDNLGELVTRMDTEGRVKRYRDAVESYNAKQDSKYMRATVQFDMHINVAGIQLQYTNSKQAKTDSSNKATIPSKSEHVIRETIKTLQGLVKN
jgi:hypothetical protein